MRERGKKKEKGTAKGLGQEPFHQAEKRERERCEGCQEERDLPAVKVRKKYGQLTSHSRGM